MKLRYLLTTKAPILGDLVDWINPRKLLYAAVLTGTVGCVAEFPSARDSDDASVMDIGSGADGSAEDDDPLFGSDMDGRVDAIAADVYQPDADNPPPVDAVVADMYQPAAVPDNPTAVDAKVADMHQPDGLV